MQSSMTRLIQLLVLLSTCAWMGLGCKGGGAVAGGGSTPPGQTFYARVGMHADSPKGVWLSASTNYIGTARFMPAGTAFTVKARSRSRLDLLDSEGQLVRVDFVQKHNMMSFDAWIERQFSSEPPALPANLSQAERDAIQSGKAVPGISREALFLAVGYPPTSFVPDLKAKSLKFAKTRWDSVLVDFDDSDHVESIKD